MADTPRFRSPPSPYIALGKALERAELLYAKARHFPVPVTTAADAWQMKATSSSTLQTIAALLQFGLLDDDGSKGARRVRLSPLGLSIVTDKRPGSLDRAKHIREAALKPPVFAELWEQFGDASGLADSAIIHALTYERRTANKAPFSDEAAKDVVRVYRETIAFAELSGFSQTAESTDMLQDRAAVGDLVQWSAGGVLRLPEPTRVRFVSPDGQWAFVEGSDTGIPMAELEVVALGQASSPPAAEQAVVVAQPPRSSPPRLPEETPSGAALPSGENVKLTIDGSRVLITAAVDLAGLRRLQKKLSAIAALLEDDETDGA